MKTERQITISDEIYNEIEKLVSQSVQFNSVSDFVNDVLKQFLNTQSHDLGDEERRLLEERLRDLGYLND